MSRTNDITGAVMTTKAATENYREGYDRIFGNKKKVQVEGQATPYIDTEGGIYAPNWPAKPESEPLHTESALDHLAHRDAERSDPALEQWARTRSLETDREWAVKPANLREGTTTHVPGVGDV